MSATAVANPSTPSIKLKAFVKKVIITTLIKTLKANGNRKKLCSNNTDSNRKSPKTTTAVIIAI